MFALRLDAFRDHQGVKSTTVLTHSVKSTPQTFASFPVYAHGGAGANPLIVFAATKYSAPTEVSKTPLAELLVDAASWPEASLLAGGGARPVGADKGQIMGFGAADVAPGNLAILGRVSETVDVTPNYPHDEHVMVAFSAELADAPPASEMIRITQSGRYVLSVSEDPSQPSIISVTNITASTALVTSSAYVSPSSEAHQGTRYQVQLPGGDWTSLVYDSGWLGAVESATVLNLSALICYQVRVKYRDIDFDESEWS